MRRMFCVFLSLLMFLCLIACGKVTGDNDPDGNTPSAKEDFIPDIRIDEIDWSLKNGTVQGKNYIILEFTNNSKYTINMFELKFEGKKNLSKEDKAAIYADIQKVQGFDDDWMQSYIQSREELNQPITLYGKAQETVEPNDNCEKIKCYFNGGWGSRDAHHAEKFDPTIATIEYVKDGKEYIVYYNFESQLYDCEEK